ncbi:MAG: alcohol dehydrogenase catalytic domain-containing protein [Janthinobacterium lividum]
MLAAIYDRTGLAREVLRVVELPDPHPGPGEVRVRLRWSGINPSDVKSRAAPAPSGLPHSFVVPHSDGMGVIDELGDGVGSGRLGQRVWLWKAAWNPLGGRQFGTAARYVVLPTALHALSLHGGIEGRSVLVSGGAGAVGRHAIQFARLPGARQVIATASTLERRWTCRYSPARAKSSSAAAARRSSRRRTGQRSDAGCRRTSSSSTP